MNRRMWPIDRTGNITVIHRIDMYIIHMSLKVSIVTNNKRQFGFHVDDDASKQFEMIEENCFSPVK